MSVFRAGKLQVKSSRKVFKNQKHGTLQKKMVSESSRIRSGGNGKLLENRGIEIPIQVEDANFPDSEEVINDFFMHEIYVLVAIPKATGRRRY